MQVAKEDVSYLALEGGGGKGVTYLGAIRALEAMQVLPIDIRTPGTSQILGISGASAGAITALLLGMGLRANQLEAILSRPETFTAFFDGPDPGRFRLVDRAGQSTVGGRARDDSPGVVAATAGAAARIAALSSPTVTGLQTGALALLNSVTSSQPILRQLQRAPQAYLNNLIRDRGLFPGFAARRLFQRMMSQYLSRRILERAAGDFSRVRGAETIGFGDFYDLTGVDLVITGANITTRRPAMFSKRLTPDFPVADAVAISMSLPVLFKPAYIDTEVPITPFNEDPRAYKGFWVDGGLLNNLPIHAFDANYLDPAQVNAAVPLNSHVVALRLTDGSPPGSGPRAPEPDPADVGLGPFLGGLAETLLYPAEGGQLRTGGEAEQTIDLYTYKLQTTNFAPDPADSQEPIEQAERSVNRYFGVTAEERP